MSAIVSDPNTLTKDKLKKELAKFNVPLPPSDAKKQTYVSLYEQHVMKQSEFSSEDENNPLSDSTTSRKKKPGSPRKSVSTKNDSSAATADLNSLSDQELVKLLKVHNIEYGPILATTRRIYLKKLEQALHGAVKAEPVKSEPIQPPVAAPSPRRAPVSAPSPRRAPVAAPSPRRAPVSAPSPRRAPVAAPSPRPAPIAAPSPRRPPARRQEPEENEEDEDEFSDQEEDSEPEPPRLVPQRRSESLRLRVIRNSPRRIAAKGISAYRDEVDSLSAAVQSQTSSSYRQTTSEVTTSQRPAPAPAATPNPAASPLQGAPSTAWALRSDMSAGAQPATPAPATATPVASQTAAPVARKFGLSIWIQIAIFLVVAALVYFVLQNMDPAHRNPARNLLPPN